MEAVGGEVDCPGLREEEVFRFSVREERAAAAHHCEPELRPGIGEQGEQLPGKGTVWVLQPGERPAWRQLPKGDAVAADGSKLPLPNPAASAGGRPKVPSDQPFG